MDRFFAQLRTSIKSIFPLLSEEEWLFLHEQLELVTLEKGEDFIASGEIQNRLGFVAEGLLRGFYINDKGEEVTTLFTAENGYATHYTALLNREPSKYCFRCLEPSKIVLISLDAMREGYRRFHGLETFGRLIAENILSSQQRRIEGFQFLNAEERYLQFLEENPHLAQRISLSHLSSYLGIQRPSLSRIRKNIAAKGRL